ncbi:hypothetical protein HHI36_004571 [Cryptolaemus montrouzieri]|uniref:Uncharacterized protein n=1 Tax=Cryptolaemus montrouzieri TaxID=559131 RepID=A0ABD2NRY7_9CUCU
MSNKFGSNQYLTPQIFAQIFGKTSGLRIRVGQNGQKKIIKDIEPWLHSEYRKTNYFSTDLLTGHGTSAGTQKETVKAEAIYAAFAEEVW